MYSVRETAIPPQDHHIAETHIAVARIAAAHVAVARIAAHHVAVARIAAAHVAVAHHNHTAAGLAELHPASCTDTRPRPRRMIVG